MRRLEVEWRDGAGRGPFVRQSDNGSVIIDREKTIIEARLNGRTVPIYDWPLSDDKVFEIAEARVGPRPPIIDRSFEIRGAMEEIRLIDKACVDISCNVFDNSVRHSEASDILDLHARGRDRGICACCNKPVAQGAMQHIEKAIAKAEKAVLNAAYRRKQLDHAWSELRKERSALLDKVDALEKEQQASVKEHTLGWYDRMSKEREGVLNAIRCPTEWVYRWEVDHHLYQISSVPPDDTE